jgi:hypothetical protein
VTTDLDHRRALLTAALGFALLDTRGKEHRGIGGTKALLT